MKLFHDTDKKQEIHISHFALWGIAVVFSWILWVIIYFPMYKEMEGKELFLEILQDFAQQMIETTVLLELSLLYIKLIVKALWSWKKNMKNLLFHVMLLAILNGFSSAGMGVLYHQLYPDEAGLFAKIAFSDYLNLSVLTTAYLVVFLMNRYRAELQEHWEAEQKLKEEEILLLQSKLQNLSLQTNNHFVFNCFSTLSGLISTSPEKAEEFLQELSSVYRYLVSQGAKTVVSLSSEIHFIKDYISLVKCRHTGISFFLDETLTNLDGFTCPVALQSLVENAVKHNRHGKENPLSIRIFRDGEDIIVSNNKMERDSNALGTRSGLRNLKQRFAMLTDKQVKIIDSPDRFEVRVPILYLEDLKDESIDY